MSTGKTYLLHKIFDTPSAHALTGKWHWSMSGNVLPKGVLQSSDGYSLQDSSGVYLISKEDE